MPILDPPQKLDAVVKQGRAVRSDMRSSLTITALLAELEESGLRGSERHIERAALNERFFHGLDLFEETRDDFISREARRNYMRNMVLTWSARFQEDRASVKAYSTHPEAVDLGGAKVANALIEHFHEMQELDQVFMDSGTYAQLHAKSAFKITWEKTKGAMVQAPVLSDFTGEPELDEDGEVILEDLGAEGDISFERITPFDYYYPHTVENVQESDWVVFRRYLDETSARGLLIDLTGNEDINPGLESFSPVPGVNDEGVPVHEIWYRKSDRIPKGLYALVIGGHVAEHSEYPYSHNELPVCEWGMNPIRGTRWGTSHVDDAVHLQRRINELEAAQVDFTQKTHHARLLCLPSIQSELDSDVQSIAVEDINSVSQGARWIDPPKPPDSIFDQMNELIQAMYDIFGLNEVVTGKDSVKSGTSAKQIAYLNRLDSMKMAVALRSFESAVRRSWRQVFSLTQQFLDGERLVKIAGPGGELSVMAFKAADLDHVDIHIEPASGIERWRAQESAEATEDLQTGKVSLQEGMERAETGLGETMGNAAARQKATQVVMQALSGQVGTPDPTIPPPVLLEVINQARGLAGGNPQAEQALSQLEQMARQAMANQPQPAAPQNQQISAPKQPAGDPNAPPSPMGR